MKKNEEFTQIRIAAREADSSGLKKKNLNKIKWILNINKSNDLLFIDQVIYLTKFTDRTNLIISVE